jgi:hypothetical protein
MGYNDSEETDMNETNAIIHRGDPRFCRFISLGGEHVAHLEPTADHNGHRLPYHAVLTDGTEAMFDTLAQVRAWVEFCTTPAPAPGRWVWVTD